MKNVVNPLPEKSKKKTNDKCNSVEEKEESRSSSTSQY
jgi:hypothetical protein